MPRLDDIRARIGKVEELTEIVGAVRTLAAVRVRQAETSVSAIAAYATIIEAALAQALTLAGIRPHPAADAPAPELPRPASTQPSRQTSNQISGHIPTLPMLLITVGSEHGFVGNYNDMLLDAAAGELGTAGAGSELAVLGTRAALMAEERRMEMVWTLVAPTHRGRIEPAVRELFVRLRPLITRSDSREIRLLHVPHVPGQPRAVARQTLWPIPLHRFARAPAPQRVPLHHLPAEELLLRFLGEYLQAELARVVTEAFAGENWARLESMDQAQHNIEDKLEELRALAHRLRQDEITTEILDVVVGAMAITDETAG